MVASKNGHGRCRRRGWRKVRQGSGKMLGLRRDAQRVKDCSFGLLGSEAKSVQNFSLVGTHGAR